MAELDYLLATRVGSDAEQALLQEVATGAYELVTFTAQDIGQACQIIEKYADLNIGLADASIVLMAEQQGTRDVLTLDERHFRTLTTARGQPFRLLPADV